MRRTLPLLTIPLLALAACQPPAATTAPPATVTQSAVPHTESPASPSSSAPASPSTQTSASGSSSATSSSAPKGEEACLATVKGAIICVDLPEGVTATKSTSESRTEQLLVSNKDGSDVLTLLSAPEGVGGGCGPSDIAKGEVITTKPVKLDGVKQGMSGAIAPHAITAVGTEDGLQWQPRVVLSNVEGVDRPGQVDHCALVMNLMIFEAGGGIVARAPQTLHSSDAEARTALEKEPFVTARKVLETIRTR